MRLVIFDATRKPSILDETWGIGSFSMWFRGRTDGMFGVLNWNEAFTLLRNRSNEYGLIKEVQIWSHGKPGQVLINGEKLTDFINDNIVIEVFKKNPIMDPNGLFWFRTCSTFQGEIGKQFAKDFSNIVGCRIAGHTHIIGCPTHSGLHSIKPNEEPSWPNEEGRNKKGKLLKSRIWRTNTIMFWRNTVPEGW